MFKVIKSINKNYGYVLQWNSQKAKPSYMLSNIICWYRYKRDAIKRAEEMNKGILKELLKDDAYRIEHEVNKWIERCHDLINGANYEATKRAYRQWLNTMVYVRDKRIFNKKELFTLVNQIDGKNEAMASSPIAELLELIWDNNKKVWSY